MLKSTFTARKTIYKSKTFLMKNLHPTSLFSTNSISTMT